MSLPGYVDIERFGSFAADDLKVEINLSGALLKLLSSSMQEEDGEFAQLLRSLQGIRVNVYAIHDDASVAAKRINTVLADLQRRGWESVVRIRQEENLHILVRYDDDSILGLLAAFVEPGESIGFVNIVGDFDPAQLGRLARKFDLDGLDAFDVATPKPKSP